MAIRCGNIGVMRALKVRRPFRRGLSGPVAGAYLGLRIADGLGQHLVQFSLGFCRFPLGWVPFRHARYMGMLGAQLNPAGQHKAAN